MQVVDGQPRGAPELVQPDIAPIAVHWIGLTGDGSYYYSQSDWVSDVYVATLDPATGTLEPPQKLVSHVGPDTSPDWSPDGRYLAYAFDAGSEFDSRVLGIRSIRTGEERRLQLTMPRVHAFQLHWSPDGRSLLAQGRLSPPTLPGVQAFYRIDAQTGEITPIVIRSLELPSNNPEVTQGGMEWPVWSSDGKAIFYRRWDNPPNGEQSLVVRNLSTTETSKPAAKENSIAGICVLLERTNRPRSRLSQQKWPTGDIGERPTWPCRPMVNSWPLSGPRRHRGP